MIRRLLALWSACLALVAGPVLAQSMPNGSPTDAWETPYTAGNWYSPPFTTAIAGSVFTAGRIYAYPFVIFQTMNIQALGVKVTTVGSSNVQVAIYASSGNYPNGAAVCSTGNIVNTAAAAVSAVCSQGTVTLTPGIYWAETNVNDATMICTTISAASNPAASFAGNSTLANVAFQAAGVGFDIQQTQTFGTWPTESSSGWTLAGATPKACMVFFEAA